MHTAAWYGFLPRLRPDYDVVLWDYEYRAIATPALIMAAEDDRVIAPKVQKKIASILPNSRFEIIPDSGPVAYLEKPELFFGAARRLFASKRVLGPRYSGGRTSEGDFQTGLVALFRHVDTRSRVDRRQCGCRLAAVCFSRSWSEDGGPHRPRTAWYRGTGSAVDADPDRVGYLCSPFTDHDRDLDALLQIRGDGCANDTPGAWICVYNGRIRRFRAGGPYVPTRTDSSYF